jgi:REP element-mobilizing transposase RayT
MVYNPRIHHRKSIRLKGYDYSQEGVYFITICVQNKKMLFGKIARPATVGTDPRVCPICPINPDNDQQIPDKNQPIPNNDQPIPDNNQEKNKTIPSFSSKNSDPELTLNDAGRMIEKWFLKLEDKFPDIKCDIFIVMPDHVHCIIVNKGMGNKNIAGPTPTNNDPKLDRTLITGETSILDGSSIMGELMGEPRGEHLGSPLGSVMQWFKTMSTNEYIRGVKTLDWERFDGKLWQRNYWEHIIRDKKAYTAIRKYIINNPRNWNVDKHR